METPMCFHERTIWHIWGLCCGPNCCAQKQMEVLIYKGHQNRWCLFSSHGFPMAISWQTKDFVLFWGHPILRFVYIIYTYPVDLFKHGDTQNSKKIHILSSSVPLKRMMLGYVNIYIYIDIYRSNLYTHIQRTMYI